MSRKTLIIVILSLFAFLGLASVIFSGAAAPNISVEPESGTIALGSSRVADTTASGGAAIKFGQPITIPPPPPPPTGIPSKQSIIDGAGPTNEGILTTSGSITVTTSGQVVENVRVNGRIMVRANNVTIRNCVVRGYTKVSVISLDSGFNNLTVQNCRVEAVASGTSYPSSSVGVVGGATGLKVRNSEILGVTDGIKAGHNSLFEYNYIHMAKPAGSTKHLDGIQGSGKSNWRASYNVFDLGHERGGNYSLFAQGFNGTSCVKITNVEFSRNYIYGGNYGIAFAGGKANVCTNPGSYAENLRGINNVFIKDPDGVFGSSSTKGFRYGYWSTQSVGAATTISGNVFEDGTPVIK